MAGIAGITGLAAADSQGLGFACVFLYWVCTVLSLWVLQTVMGPFCGQSSSSFPKGPCRQDITEGKETSLSDSLGEDLSHRQVTGLFFHHNLCSKLLRKMGMGLFTSLLGLNLVMLPSGASSGCWAGIQVLVSSNPHTFHDLRELIWYLPSISTPVKSNSESISNPRGGFLILVKYLED